METYPAKGRLTKTRNERAVILQTSPHKASRSICDTITLENKIPKIHRTDSYSLPVPITPGSINALSKVSESPKSVFKCETDPYRFTELDSYICVPISINKKPSISWKNVTTTPKSLFKKDHNVALITGKINGITVIDIDIPKSGKDELDGMRLIADLLKKHNNGNCLETPICKTQSGGLHLYFKYDSDIKTRTGINGYSIDVRNDNALIIAPPSVGIKGPYVWIDGLSLLNTDLSEIPDWLKNWLNSDQKKIVKAKEIKETQKNYPIRDNMYIYDKHDIINLLNKLPNKYLANYDDWFIVTSCLKSEELFDIWDDWSKSKNSRYYDAICNIKQWNSFTPKININYLSVLAKKENIISEPHFIKSTKRINFLTVKPNLRINKCYVDKNDIIISNNSRDNMFVNTTIVKSGCGTGKTTFSCSYINELIRNGNYKFLSVSVRVSLAYQQIANFEKNKLIVSNYKNIIDNTELNSQKNLIVQVDSLIRIKPNKWNNTIIYLDEISCLFNYILTSSTLDNKRMCVFNTLYELLVGASQILVTDADINDMVLAYFDKIKVKYHLIENTYKNSIKTPAIEYDSKEVLLQQIEMQLSNSQPIIVCFDSKKEMDVTVERFKKYCEDNGLKKQLNNFLIYSSTEGNENDFMHINDRWKDKNIFMTPKVTIGVSFDNKISRNVYLIALGNSINSVAFVQQISRCRNIKELHYYVVKKYQPLRYNSVDDVKEHFGRFIQDYDNLCYTNIKKKNSDYNNEEMYLEQSDNDKLKIIVSSGNATKDLTKSGEWTIHESVFNDLFFYNEYYDNILRSAPREQFRWLLEDKNFHITHNKVVIEDDKKKIITSDNKDCKERIEANYEQLCQRALYNKVSSLTENEKKIRENAVRRAKYLRIDFSKKVQKKKWEKFLISDIEFSRHIAYKLLMESEDKLDSKIATQIEKDYKISICNNLETKVKLIKQIEKILKVKTLDIDTQREMNRFNEDIVIDNALLNLIKKMFRIGKASNKIAGNFEQLYYQLIQLYKNILGNNICIYKRAKINNVNYGKFNMNIDVLNEHNNLSKL